MSRIVSPGCSSVPPTGRCRSREPSRPPSRTSPRPRRRSPPPRARRRPSPACPLTSGTGTGRGPSLTTSVTDVPSGRVAWRGRTAIARAPHRSRRGSDAAPVRPGAPRRRAARAFASGRPVTSGTWTGGGPFEGTTEIVVPTSRSARAAGGSPGRGRPGSPDGTRPRGAGPRTRGRSAARPRRRRSRRSAGTLAVCGIAYVHVPQAAPARRQQEDRAHDPLQACDAAAVAAPSAGSRPSRGGRPPPSSPRPRP